ncbi:hypothetical protein QBC47DRAFT_168614 [Echria macrotheca]|uniref:2EXR domain-containing protein n=1 Tax=Echria macrotheca TaxID=438768 RepID=A0AAJ0FCN5_9PEZI|nr:hypothetical protein QBC47DRAFT_168614 [Echria macrotheca]
MAAPHDSGAEGFPLFRRFSTEIRLMIWEEACNVERIIPILPGQGHLFPRVHPTLAVPPVLHACSESRGVALKHYNLSFHPHIYINQELDQLMFHLLYPHQQIHFQLYKLPEAGFCWEAAPRRLAVLFDDTGFHQSDEDFSNKAWRTDPSWRRRLRPISRTFVTSLLDPQLQAIVKELTLLVLPPLTARPNCSAHRFDLVEDAPEFVEMGEYLTSELASRECPFGYWPDGWETLKWPVVRVRHATCSAWPSSSDATEAMSWSAALRQRHSAVEYADMEFGIDKKPQREPGTFMSFPNGPFHVCTERRTRIQAIRHDLKMLNGRFCADVGLGPHAIWEERRYMCGTSMMMSGIHSEADRQLLWVDGHEDELPKLPEPRPLTGVAEFDFDSFLKDDIRFDPEWFNRNWEEEKAKKRRWEEEDVDDERDPWNMECLWLNGLWYWTR